jgi:hypothetical protein
LITPRVSGVPDVPNHIHHDTQPVMIVGHHKHSIYHHELFLRKPLKAEYEPRRDWHIIEIIIHRCVSFDPSKDLQRGCHDKSIQDIISDVERFIESGDHIDYSISFDMSEVIHPHFELHVEEEELENDHREYREYREYRM